MAARSSPPMCPGRREVVRDGENGLLVPSGDVAALIGALRRLTEDREIRRRTGAKGPTIAMQHFSEEDVVRRTMQVYQELNLGRPGNNESG